MPRVNTQVARNDIYQYGLYVPDQKTKSGKRLDRSKPRDKDDKVIVKKGETYYWWKFRYGGKTISKTYPKPSQLTQSEFLSTIYDIQDRISECQNCSSPDELLNFVDEIKNDLENLKSETEDKLSNMPEQLQYAPTGELLQERIDMLDLAISELDSIDLDYEEPDEEELKSELESDVDGWDDMGDDEKTQHIEDRLGELEREWIEEKFDEITSVSLDC